LDPGNFSLTNAYAARQQENICKSVHTTLTNTVLASAVGYFMALKEKAKLARVGFFATQRTATSFISERLMMETLNLTISG